MAQLGHEGGGDGAGFVGATLQGGFDGRGVFHELFVDRSHGGDFLVQALENLLFGLTPSNALGVGLSKSGGFFGTGKGLVKLKEGGAVGGLGLTRRFGVGHDAHDQFAQLGWRREERDGVVVALAHLATVQTRQCRHVLFNHGLWRREVLAVEVVEARGHVARHFNVLDLVSAHRHLMGVEHQNVRAHEHGVHEQAGGHARVGLFPRRGVFVDRRFVGVGAVEHAFASHASQEPGQLGDFGHIALAVKRHVLRVQAAGQPSCGDFQRGALHARGVTHLDEGVVVGQKVKAFNVGQATGAHGGPNGTHVVAQVGCARGGDAGENAGGGHEQIIPKIIQ